MAQHRIIKCAVYHKDNLYIACCLDFCLFAQGEDRLETQSKLKAQILDYIDYAHINPKLTERLLNKRKAPFSEWVLYFCLVLRDKFFKTKMAESRLAIYKITF